MEYNSWKNEEFLQLPPLQYISVGLTQSYTRYSFPSVRLAACSSLNQTTKNNMLFPYGIRAITHLFYIPCSTASSLQFNKWARKILHAFADEETVFQRHHALPATNRMSREQTIVYKHTANTRDHEQRYRSMQPAVPSSGELADSWPTGGYVIVVLILVLCL